MEVRADVVVPCRPADAFAALLDPAGLARCVPGQTVTATRSDRVEGMLRLRSGAGVATWRGHAALVRADPAARTAVLEARGDGGARATLTATAEPAPADGHARVRLLVSAVEGSEPATTLPAALAHGIGQRVVAQFAANLEARLVAAGASGGASPEAGGPPPGGRPAGGRTAVTARAVASRPALAGVAVALAGTLVALALALVRLRRRRT